MNSSKKISIVLLNWNGSSFLQRFLPSVVGCSEGNTEIIVADNGSTDNSKEVVETNFPTVKFLQLHQNYGFADGYNKALVQVTADYLVFLNTDVKVTPGWLDPMAELLDNDPAIGICQPKILSLDRPDEFEYAGAAGGFIDRYGYPYCRGRILQEVEKDLGQYNNSISVSWASGACMMVRADLWKQCNGFDADFWAHMEEIDLCWRAQHLGYRIMVCPESVVYHIGGGTLNYDSPLKIHLNFRNNLFLLYKNLPGSQLATKLPARMILDGLAALVFLLKGETRSFAKVFSAHLKFYKSLPSLTRKRKAIFRAGKDNRVRLTSGQSILWNYFVRKRRKFSELNS